MTEILTVNI